MPDSFLILNTFEPAIWLAIAICLLAATIAYSTIHHTGCLITANSGHTRRIPASRYDRLTAALTSAIRVAGAMLSRPDRVFGRTLAERILLTVGLWHAVVVSGIFQGQLFHAYTHRQTAANVNTIEELAALPDMRLAIRYRNIMTDVLGDESQYSTPVLQRLRSKVIFVPANTSVYETVLGTPNVADIDRLVNFRMVAQQYRRADGFSSVHMLKEYPK